MISASVGPVVDHELLAVLAEAQGAGFLGKAALDDHVDNGVGFAGAIRAAGGTTCADLGSGGGVPALVIARTLPTIRITCIDRGTRRCEFLEDAVVALGLEDRVSVVEGDAEDVARLADHEAAYDIVTARSFGPPAVTAEAATRLLMTGGNLLVSEPPAPEGGGRWDAPQSLDALGLAYAGLFDAGDVRIAMLSRTDAALDGRFPRRSATVRKRPLF